jgi:hypothetical protein
MRNRLSQVAERLLGRVLPAAKAEASQCCGGGCGYQYRCTSTGAYQRRYCCYDCNCVASCGSWSTIAKGC